LVFGIVRIPWFQSGFNRSTLELPKARSAPRLLPGSRFFWSKCRISNPSGLPKRILRHFISGCSGLRLPGGCLWEARFRTDLEDTRNIRFNWTLSLLITIHADCSLEEWPIQYIHPSMWCSNVTLSWSWSNPVRTLLPAFQE
jgi:hypothetical protein